MPTRQTRLKQLEAQAGRPVRPDCPMLAVGLPVEGGLSIAGKVYAMDVLGECFHGRPPVIILDEGPDDDDTKEG